MHNNGSLVMAGGDCWCRAFLCFCQKRCLKELIGSPCLRGFIDAQFRTKVLSLIVCLCLSACCPGFVCLCVHVCLCYLLPLCFLRSGNGERTQAGTIWVRMITESSEILLALKQVMLLLYYCCLE